MCARTAGLFFVLISFLTAEVSVAQQFGRNKVKYHEPEFVVKNTPNFAIHHYNDNDVFMADAAYITERWYERLREIFKFRFPAEHPVVYYRNQMDFQQTFITLGFIGQGTRGFTEAFQQRLVMPYTGTYSSFDHIVGHEMVHVFQYKAAMRHGRRGLQNLTQLPLWFIEGKAEYLSTGDVDAHTAMYLRDAMIRDDLPSLRDLSRRQRDFFPYRFGHAFWAYVASEYGDDVIAPMLYRAIESGNLNDAFRSVLNISTSDFSDNWKEAISSAYEPELAKRDTPGQFGMEVLSPDKHAGSMNLAPSLSPDGEKVIFFSERDLFSTELFLANARTGEIEDRLTRTAVNRHFESLNFMESGGTWSPDGRNVAFVITESGRHKIAIMNINRGSVTKKIDIGEVDEISTPTWSPDGQKLAFSGLKDGWSNLYLVDRASEELEQLTEGRHSDMHPEWHPGGEKLLFASDRGHRTDFEKLVYGPPQLAIYHLEDGDIEVLNIFNEGKHINPKYGPDGDNIYFISDHDGFSNIYRVNVADGDLFRITNYATGVSGITENAPAMSVASESGALMYSVFNAAEYIVYRLEGDDALGEPYQSGDPEVNMAMLPPFDPGKRTIVNAYLEDPDTEAEIDREHPEAPYEPSLALDWIGQGGIGIGIGDPFSSGVGGAITAQFSDILGDHRLTSALFMQGNSIEDLGMQALYQNFERRWQWGVMASRIPFGFSQFFRGPNNSLIERRTRQTLINGDLIVQYPFSQTLRFETGVGYTQFRFSREEIQRFQDGTADRRSLDARAPMHFFNTNLYLVGDNSYFGFTSPVMGWRYRIGGQPNIGSLTYSSGLADFRYYQFFNPVTLAVRGIYTGRYGNDREDPNLRAMYLGNNYYIRGYRYNYSDIDAECEGNLQDCTPYERLLGSQMVIANFETRLPLFGTDQFGLINFPYIPTEISGFVDAGVAWNSEEEPELKFTRESNERTPVMSTGVTSRFNLLGAIILEIYYAYPLQRPEKGAHFGFSIFPGW